MKSKWLEFRIVSRKNKTLVWTVHNHKTNDYLGVIKWYSQWRQYCFIPHGCVEYSVIFSQSCLRDIAEFIKEQMNERKK